MATEDRGMTDTEDLELGIGRAIRQTRLAQGLRQQDIADRADIDQSYISQVERGKIQFPSPRILWRIADALGVSEITILTEGGYIRKSKAAEHGEVVLRLTAFEQVLVNLALEVTRNSPSATGTALLAQLRGLRNIESVNHEHQDSE